MVLLVRPFAAFSFFTVVLKRVAIELSVSPDFTL